MVEFALTGPRGDNPLGFLTALGALVALGDAGYRAVLGWQRLRPTLIVSCESTATLAAVTGQEEVVRVLHETLGRSPGEGASETESARKAMEEAKRALKKRTEEIKRRKLARDAARDARRLELEPLRQEVEQRTRDFKTLLARTAPDPSVTLGKNLTEPNRELIAHATDACEHTSPPQRRWVDLVGAYGVADPARPEERMLASPWALISGSGHQDFLSSVQSLMVECTRDHLQRALFGPWDASDEKYSLRLEPREDRRYALMDRDPTGSGNKPLTLWGANRLAFEVLRLFPCLPARDGMAVLAWRASNASWQVDCSLRWPLWDEPVSAEVVRSLLGLPDIWLDREAAARLRLRGLGIRTVMESRRIAVGEGANRKYNVTPAAPVWVVEDVAHLVPHVEEYNVTPAAPVWVDSAPGARFEPREPGGPA